MPDYDILKFGREQQPIVIIDDFLPGHEKLVEATRSARFEPRGIYYPGVRCPVDASYLGARMELIKSVLTDVFDMGNGARLEEANASYVTTAPSKLTPIQRLPHYDGVDPKKLAFLHYLCPSERGGTAFYRHKATGFETITQDRFERYKSVLEAEAEVDGLPPPQYFDGHHPRFERIGHIKARPNRMAIYRGITLHSGDIPDGLPLVTDPDQGRLTINIFMTGK